MLYFEKSTLKETVGYILSRIGDFNPQVGVILGTGLGAVVSDINIEYELGYAEIPHFPVSTVESHSGKLVFGTLEGVRIVAMQGRFHFYEGYSMQQVAWPVRVIHALGVKQLLISNAAGAINPNFEKGRLMLITDHINLLMDNPLIGPNVAAWGTRFPDMSEPYSKELGKKMQNIARDLGAEMYEGVYIAMAGPALETRSEYRFLRNLGGDVVGMSTVPEVIVANHVGLPCVAISVLTDECDPDNLKPVTLAEILQVAGTAEKDLVKIFKAFLKNL